MRRVIAGVVCILMIAQGPGVSTARAQSPSALELVRLVNEFRAANGMPALEVNDALMTAAQRHAEWEAINRIDSHRGEGGSLPQDRATAAGYRGRVNENAAGGTIGYATLEWAVEGWSNSPVHRAAMLSKNVHVGAGVAQNSEYMYYILLVGSPSGSAPASTSSGASKSPTERSERSEAAAGPAPIAPPVIATPDAGGAVVHVVQAGQTAWTIAAWYGIPLAELLALNHLDEKAVLHPGDKVIIRQGMPQTAPPSPGAPAATISPVTPTLPTAAPSPTPAVSPPDGAPADPAATSLMAGGLTAGIVIALGLIALVLRRPARP